MKRKSKLNVKNHKKELMIGVIFFFFFFVCIVFLFLNSDKKGSNNIGNNNDSENETNSIINDVDSTKVTEEDIMEIYNFSKEDAKKLVQSSFNSDTFEFNVIVNDEGKYIVTAKSLVNTTIYRYEVDPSTKTYSELIY